MNKERVGSAGLPGRKRLLACWLLVALFLGAILWASIAPDTPGGTAAAGIQFMAMLLFIVLHSSLAVGWRGTIIFIAALGLTSFALEALSIATGFPFGFFEHHTAGPRPLDVPLAVPVGYVVFGWFAWALAQTILRPVVPAAGGMALWVAPIVAAFLLAGYDYPWDAIGASVHGTHSYRHPSGLFGVPLSNFLGWLLTSWVAFQLFAFAARRFSSSVSAQGMSFDMQPAIMWLGIGLSYFLQWAGAPDGLVEQGESRFLIRDIYEGAAAISLPSMIFPALLAVIASIAWRRQHGAP